MILYAQEPNGIYRRVLSPTIPEREKVNFHIVIIGSFMVWIPAESLEIILLFTFTDQGGLAIKKVPLTISHIIRSHTALWI